MTADNVPYDSTPSPAERSKERDLKPCPFCGWPANIIGVVGVFYAQCRDCGAEGPTEETEDAAIAAWNRRHEAKP